MACAFVLTSGALVLAALASMGLGAVSLRPDQVLSALGLGPMDPAAAVVWHLRVPRILLAICVGASLSVAGALMQGLFRNPLADPGLVGVSSGAALGAVAIIVLGGTFFPGLPVLSDLRLLPFAAFLGALGVAFLIHALALTSGYTAVATLLLAGIAVNALVGAVIGFATFVADDAQLRSVAFWSLGSLGGASWESLAMAAPFCLGLVIVAPLFAHALNALSLGEAEAGHLGFSVEWTKRLAIAATAAGIGGAVAFTGIIGFVGLVVPHLVRLWIGPDHTRLIPLSALLGALVLLIADTAARTVAAPAELPIGILTAAFGAPFFLMLLLHKRGGLLHG